jgi:hypothetical protein
VTGVQTCALPIFLGGGVGGGVFMAIIGLIRNALAKK